jgi:hypothetical protein
MRWSRGVALWAILVAGFIPSQATADPAPYEHDYIDHCTGTNDWDAAADRSTGSLTARVAIGGSPEGLILPNYACADAWIEAERRGFPEGWYRVTARVVVPISGLGAPSVSSSAPDTSSIAPLAGASVDIAMFPAAVTCDGGVCEGSAPGDSRNLACTGHPHREPCSNPGPVELIGEVYVPDDPTAYIRVEVYLRVRVERVAPPFTVSASGAVMVEDISITMIEGPTPCPSSPPSQSAVPRVRC